MKMNKFSHSLTDTPITIILLIALIITYLLPWISSASVGLTLNGYDLAEWTSLHPQVYSANPPLITTLLLRIPLVCIALIAAFTVRFRTWVWWVGTCLTMAIIIMLLPPLEFINERGNTNYRQLAILAVLTFVGVGIGLSGVLSRWRWGIIVFVSLVGIVASSWGLIDAFDLYAQFFLPRQISIGGVLTVLLFFVMLIVGITHLRRKTG